MTRLKGITITLITKQVAGEDPFGAPITADVETPVDNVLVAPVSTDDALNTLNLTGKQVVYQLGIPKGDANDWANAEVRFFGQRWRTVGVPLEGIEDMIPLRWNKKVQVERYE